MATRTLTWVWQDTATGITYVDAVTTSMSLVSLGSTTMGVDHPLLAPENLMDSD